VCFFGGFSVLVMLLGNSNFQFSQWVSFKTTSGNVDVQISFFFICVMCHAFNVNV
jgi:hypothetical protein